MSDAPTTDVAIRADAPSGYRVEQAMSVYQSMRARLMAEDPSLDAEEFGEAEGDVRDLLARILRSAVDATAFAKMIKERRADLKIREDRYNARAEARRGVGFAMLEALGEKRFVLPDLTASIGKSRGSVVVTDIDRLPPEYVEITKAAKKTEIAADIAMGVVIDGAFIDDGIPSFSIRTK